MLLSMNVAGITFSGADVGGFFGDPDVELLLRWNQVAAFQPFFRGHAHIDAKRREPWLFGEPWTSHIRSAIRARYAFLPYTYTVFREAATTGVPIMRPLWLEFPSDKTTFAIEQEFMLGDSLLIKPVTSAGQVTASVYLPGSDSLWYDLVDGKQLKGGVHTTMDCPLERIPILQRGGSIVPKRERARRSSAAMENDPFTLVIALDQKLTAAGSLYLDDGKSFKHETGSYLLRSFRFADNKLASTALHPTEAFPTDLMVERVVIYGLDQAPNSATLTSADGTEAALVVLFSAGVCVIRKPDAMISQDWTITLH